MFKKLNQLGASLIILMLISTSVFGQTFQDYTLLDKEASEEGIVPIDSAYTFGLPSQRWAKIYGTAADFLTATIGAIASGALTITVDDANAFLVETAGNVSVFNVDTITPEVRIDSDLGINVTPTVALHIEDSTTVIGKLTNTTTSGSSAGAFVVLGSDDGAANAANDRLGGFLFSGMKDATTGSNGGGIAAFADALWTLTSAPTRLEFEVAPVGSTSRATAMTINNDKSVDLGSSTVDAGTFTLIKGAQTGDPQFAISLSADALGDVTMASDTGGIAFTVGTGEYTFDNDIWLRGVDNAGTGNVNMFKINASDEIETGGVMNVGTFNISEDSGAVAWLDFPVSATPAAGTEESVIFSIDSNNMLRLYTEADSSGGTQNETVEFSVITAYTPSADLALLAATTITPSEGITRVVGSGGAVTLTGTPTIVDPALDGTCIRLQGTNDTNTVTIQDEGNLANSGFQLAGGIDFAMGIGDMWEGCYDSGDDNWYEVSRSDN